MANANQADIDRAAASMNAESDAVDALVTLANDLAAFIRANATNPVALLAAADRADAAVAKVAATVADDSGALPAPPAPPVPTP